MKQSEIVIEFIKKNKGQITTEDAKRLSISRSTLYQMEKNGLLEKLSAGFFIVPKEFGDDMAALQRRFPKGIYCRDTALFLHGMIDRTPGEYDMNFPNNNPHKRMPDLPLKMYRQIQNLYEIGIEQVESPGGHLVKVYNVERTLCDILQKRHRTDSETIKQAMNSYVKMKNKNLGQLASYADLFKVRDEVQKYMEVLL